MSRQYSSKTAVRILCALFVLISAAVAAAGPVESVQAQAPAQQVTGGVTDTWAVQISPGTDPDQLALQIGAQNLGQIGALTNYYLFRIPGTDSEAAAMADVFAANSQVVWFEQQVARQQTRRVFEDPVYLDQWHLINANVEPAWTAGFTGIGVNIAIVDDGLQHSHWDFIALDKYKSVLSHDYNGDAPLFAEDDDPEDPTYNDYHGTASAGMAAADYNGNTDPRSCGVGVAYDAGISGLRLIAAPSTPAQIADALNFEMNPASLGADFNSIYNNSWGPADDMTEPLVGPGTTELAALQAGVTSGRNGKGSIYVWAAGNGLAFKDNVNYDGYANSRYTIAVGAVDYLGEQASYSEPGAAMFVTAPSTSDTRPEAIVTTDLLGYRGYNFFGDCTDGIYGGTSAAAPIVSGVVALMLDANPNLGWRDVQNILARTAVKNDPTDADWDAKPTVPGVQTNGDGVNGLHVNHKYGFGLVDAAAAVAMADPLTYVNLGSVGRLSSRTISVNKEVPDLNADPDGDGIVSEFVVTRDITLEHVEVVFNASDIPCIAPRLTSCGGFRGDLKVVLTSPSGVQSVLSEWHDDPENDYVGWKFMTVRNWGESSLGIWTLKVTDTSGVGFSTFDSWELILHGTGLTADIDVTIGGDLKGTYTLFPGESMVGKYAVDGGPVEISSTNGANIVASLNQWRRRPSTTVGWTGVAQSMALPVELITDQYVMPRYDYSNVNALYNALLLANVDVVSRDITVTIGGEVKGTYTIGASQSQYVTYPGFVGGPVVVSSVPGARIVASLYELIREPGLPGWNDQNEMMGLPPSQLSDKYLLPMYFGAANPSVLNASLFIANADTISTTIEIKIAGISRGKYDLLPNTGQVVHYNVDGGPVEISSNNGAMIIASLNQQRRRPSTTVGWTGVAQSMALPVGLPVDLITNQYMLPRYDYSNINALYNALLLANVDVVSRDITVSIGGVVKGTYTIGASQSQYVTYPGFVGGPVVVSSVTGAKIVASLYELIREPGLPGWNGQNEMMGIPPSQLSAQYLLPSYFGAANPSVLNVSLNIGVP